MNAQTTLNGEIIVDNFAGGGGASTGMELAFGRVVDIAINHDPDAILMHKTNHPYTEHYQASVWDIYPPDVCRGRPVGLAWFSPDCKHFSKAKGSKPVEKSIRGLAWIVLRWAGTVRPRVIILENVEEFQTWGPLRAMRDKKSGRVIVNMAGRHDRGKCEPRTRVAEPGEVVPIDKQRLEANPNKRGKTFRRFVKQLRALGYDVEFRELVAADYGAPTTRKRFFMVARCDGRPIVWPEPTHAHPDSEDVKAGRKQPWRSAAEIIDWTQPMYSIFESKQAIKEKYGATVVRPLADNEIILLLIGGVAYYIRDILMRMLTPRELYNAMGFPPDYIISHDYMGNEYGKAKQEARCGNAVPPPFATALARANFPEWCTGEPITTMEELERRVAE